MYLYFTLKVASILIIYLRTYSINDNTYILVYIILPINLSQNLTCSQIESINKTLQNKFSLMRILNEETHINIYYFNQIYKIDILSNIESKCQFQNLTYLETC